MTHGGALYRVAYGIGVLLMIKRSKAEYPDITQPWYTYNSNALGMFNNIGLYFNLLRNFGPDSGYYPKPPRRFLIVHPDNPVVRKEHGLHHSFKVCTGALYLSGFIGGDKSKREWLNDRTSNWEKIICAITKTAGKYPQESYAMVVCVIQPE